MIMILFFKDGNLARSHWPKGQANLLGHKFPYVRFHYIRNIAILAPLFSDNSDCRVPHVSENDWNVFLKNMRGTRLAAKRVSVTSYSLAQHAVFHVDQHVRFLCAGKYGRFTLYDLSCALSLASPEPGCGKANWHKSSFQPYIVQDFNIKERAQYLRMRLRQEECAISQASVGGPPPILLPRRNTVKLQETLARCSASRADQVRARSGAAPLAEAEVAPNKKAKMQLQVMCDYCGKKCSRTNYSRHLRRQHPHIQRRAPGNPNARWARSAEWASKA